MQLTLFEYFYLKREFSLNFAVLSKGIQLYEQVWTKAQANTTREQSNKNNIYDVGWRPSHGENGGVGNQKKNTTNKL